MIELFRFIALRGPQKSDPALAGSLALKTPFQKSLSADAARAKPRTAIERTVADYVKSESYVRDIASLRHHGAFARLQVAVQKHKSAKECAAELRQQIASAFDQEPSRIVREESFLQDKARIFDTIIATWVATSTHRTAPLNDLARFARLILLIERAAADDATLDAEGAVGEALSRTLLLPEEVFPLPQDPPPEPPPPPPAQKGPDPKTQRATLHKQLDGLRATTRELAMLDSSSYVTPEPLKVAPAAKGKPARISPQDRQRAVSQLKLKPEAIAALSTTAKHALAAHKIDLAKTSVPAAQALVRQAIKDTMAVMTPIPVSPGDPKVAMVGKQLFVVESMPEVGMIQPDPPPPAPPPGPPPPPPPWTAPATKGTIKNVGIGDLLVVRQHIKAYEADEISYIENILLSETKKRTTVHTQTTEQTSTSETETTTETSSDLESTDHFDLKREIDTSLKEDLSIKAGLSVSAKYGSVVEVNSNLDVGFEQTKEQTTKQATDYSKDVTSRAATKVTQHVLQTQTIHTVDTFQETDEHGFDNVQGKGNIIGIYQWLNKVYEAQVFNYGKRTMFDVMVPEPAAFLIDAMKNKQNVGDDLHQPALFNLRPDDICETNYWQYIQMWTVSGVSPPPAEYVNVAHAWAESGDRQEDDDINKAYLDFKLPTGYEAFDGTAVIVATPKTSGDLNQESAIVVVGKVPLTSNATQTYVGGIAPNNEIDMFPVTVQTRHAYDITISVEVVCRRSDATFDAWRLETYNQLFAAYSKLESDYEQALADQKQQQAQNAIMGTNPATNLKLMQTELKKHCITLLTAQHFESFGAVDEGTNLQLLPFQYPEPNLTNSETQGAYIRFFEQAFEWTQIMYFFYPYYWGRKSGWYTQSLLDDNDANFADFLKAGAARVVFPVRLGFETAVQYFLDTGKVWMGGDLPAIGSPLYLSIVDEIKDATAAPPKESYVDSWDVRVPTQLVLLRKDGNLPTWAPDKKDPTKWVAS